VIRVSVYRRPPLPEPGEEPPAEIVLADHDGLRVSVADGVMLVEAYGPPLRYGLSELDNVTLDSKVYDPELSSVPMEVTPPMGRAPRARIALVVRGQPDLIPLSEGYFAHMDASEAFGKLRVFLRKHGWVPEDERV
jgi:hypothetical protein